MRARGLAAGAALVAGAFFTFGQEATAQADTLCSTILSNPCSTMADTPICVLSGLTYMCRACSSNADCTSEYINNANQATCATQGGNAGACFTCNGDNGSGTSNQCPDPTFPACHLESGPLQGKCTTCSGSNAGQCSGHALAPACVADAGVCGCTPGAADVCGAGTSCVQDTDAGAGQCLSTSGCDAGSCKTAPNLVCDTTKNSCVECTDNTQCDSDAGLVCVGGVCAGDAGTPPPSVDGGIVDEDSGLLGGDDGGSATDDGGLSDAGASDGGISGGDATIANGAVTYPYGHVEGGGCSVIDGGDGGETGTGSLASSFVTGLAALAGILSIRTRRRRNGQEQNR